MAICGDVYHSSWGYHEDGGIDHPWPEFGAGDVARSGIEWEHDRIYFTLNGKRLGKFETNHL